MKLKSDTSNRRFPRSDAIRNRARILEVAGSELAAVGSAASLEQIARDAGVGIGTLYRHFPSRDALIVAVHEHETDVLIEAACQLSATYGPAEALQVWLLRFLDFIESERYHAELANLLIGGSESGGDVSAGRLAAPIEILAYRAGGAGLRLVLSPLDMLRAIIGIRTVRPGPDWKRQAASLIDLIMGRPPTTA